MDRYSPVVNMWRSFIFPQSQLVDTKLLNLLAMPLDRLCNLLLFDYIALLLPSVIDDLRPKGS